MNIESAFSTLGFESVQHQADVVVVGAGGAAMRAAVSAAEQGASVIVVAKQQVGRGGSTVHGASEIMSMGAAGFGVAEDNPDVHFRDTMEAAFGFIDPVLVRALAEDAPKRVNDLIKYGVPFDRNPDNSYKLIRSDFGTYARALGVSGKTGAAVVKALTEQATNLGVRILSPLSLVDLIRDEDGSTAGIVAIDVETRKFHVISAKAVVLGTGGVHGLFSQQVSTPDVVGDGQAICYRHGAELVNLEFHQFGPALIKPYVQLFSKSCFVLHPVMLNNKRETFLEKYLPAGVSAEEVYDEKVFPFTISNPSKYVDIAIAREIAEGRGTENGCVYFSFDHVDQATLDRVVPNTAGWMREKGVDMRKSELEVGIAFQCLNGGVRMVDNNAQSSIPGLFVVGEISGGVRGPDRPGGNSLAEGQVFGHRAGVAAAALKSRQHGSNASSIERTVQELATLGKRNVGLDSVREADTLRQAMQQYCLVEKDQDGLSKVLAQATALTDALQSGGNADQASITDALTLRNMAQAAELVAVACLNRRESRSGHYRVDYPQTDNSTYRTSFVVKRGASGPELVEHPYATSIEQAGDNA
ncbi:MAG: dependent oxidoreductase family protein [Herminiimonas sp.]|nr:dependent oxidoreductase family protein [Herminiimonas sp.]